MNEGSGCNVPESERVVALRARMEALRFLYEMPKPTIVAIEGPAAGAGLSLALACDFRICGRNAKLTTAFASVAGEQGAIPSSGSDVMIARVGTTPVGSQLASEGIAEAETAFPVRRQAATRCLFFAKLAVRALIRARTCVSMGLITRCCNPIEAITVVARGCIPGTAGRWYKIT